MKNRLAGEQSPYLRSHKDNPVHWYPYGDDAFAAAKSSGKPIFVSIGYASCHWCHVMARESFEDPAIAAAMNELFVNVKVDREEFPEVDAFYMAAIQVMGEGGGWPLSAFCNSEGKPFYVGTYFPPEDKYGRPSFPRVLAKMSAIFQQQRSEAEGSADMILQGVMDFERGLREGGTGVELDVELLIAAGQRLGEICDPDHGGFGRKPKFPSPSAHELLARVSTLPFGEKAETHFLRQAEQMARGGIYDHLGGGFARYSVDAKWLVPHFEKMLYDNAQLLGILAKAHSLKPSAGYFRFCLETVDWLRRELQDESGGLYASLDADTEEEEGTFYVWSREEICKVLGSENGEAFCGQYGVTAAGNFQENRSVLSLLSKRGPIENPERDALETLRGHRNGREKPQIDDKILTSWNGLAVSGLLEVWKADAEGGAGALELAEEVSGFLVRHMLNGKKVFRVFQNGKPRLKGTLADYAFFAKSSLDLAECTMDIGHWQRGEVLVSAILEKFYRVEKGYGVFFMAEADSTQALGHRPESFQDGAIPSGASAALSCILRIGRATDNDSYIELVEGYLRGRTRKAAEKPFSTAALLGVLDDYLHGQELFISDGEGQEALLNVARKSFAPTLHLAGPWTNKTIWNGKENTASGKALAYLCRGQTCQEPVNSPEDLAPQIFRGGRSPSST